MKVLWLRPSVGDHISVRRERIAEHLEEMGVEVVILDASGFDSIGAVREAIGGGYDVVIGNVRVGLYLGYLLSVLLRKPLIGDVSDPTEIVDDLPTPIYRLVCWFEWWVLSRADAGFFVETTSYERAKSRGLDPVLVRNSVDYERFAEPDNDSVERARDVMESRGVDLDRPIAIYIGGMAPHYHVEEIAKAADLLPTWEFVLVGKERGAEVEELSRGRENVYFLGSHPYDLMPGFLYHSTAGFCLTDKQQPLKMMEYGAAGLPTVGLEGRLQDRFDEDEVLFVDGSPEEISGALEKLESDDDLSRELTFNLRERARHQSWRTVAEEYYEAILEASQR